MHYFVYMIFLCIYIYIPLNRERERENQFAFVQELNLIQKERIHSAVKGFQSLGSLMILQQNLEVCKCFAVAGELGDWGMAAGGQRVV